MSLTHSEDLLASIRHMKNERLSNKVIARTLGSTEEAIESLCYKHGIKRRSERSVVIGAPLILAYQAEARRREEPLEKFIRRVLRTVLQDNLFSAVLDDDRK